MTKMFQTQFACGYWPDDFVFLWPFLAFVIIEETFKHAQSREMSLCKTMSSQSVELWRSVPTTHLQHNSVTYDSRITVENGAERF